MIRCLEVSLAIPDNEARTALTTLQRLGIPVSGLERSDLYRCDVDETEADNLVTTLSGLETVYNPNKHILCVRESPQPQAGEVWIDEIGSERTDAVRGFVRVAGRTLPGVRRFERFTAWRLSVAPGRPADAGVVSAATETLLCNPAFQKALRA